MMSLINQRGVVVKNTEWMFQTFFDVGEAADHAGLKRIASLMELCMDVYVDEENRIHKPCYEFRSYRAAEARAKSKLWPIKVEPTQVGATPPGWVRGLEARIENTVEKPAPKKKCRKRQRRRRRSDMMKQASQ